MNKEKNISESTNRKEIVLAIQELNPNADISLGNPYFETGFEDMFYCSIPGDKLILPEGFYYNDKNGITNKNRTQSGMYTSLAAKPIPQGQDIRLLPKKVKDVSQSTNLYEIAEVIQSLNPYAEIRVGNADYDRDAYSRFYSSIPGSELLLPNGFYYNKKNGVTNKHNTDSGAYCDLHVQALALADERFLMPRVETIVKREKPTSAQVKQRVTSAIVKAVKNLKNMILGKSNNNAKHR